jgi:hypothetical protein
MEFATTFFKGEGNLILMINTIKISCFFQNENNCDVNEG